MSKNKGKKPNIAPAQSFFKTANSATNQSDILAIHPFWQNTRLQAFIIFITAFILYANTLGHEYAQDDAIVIKQNMFTTEGVKGISGILKYDTFYGFFKEEGKATLVAGGRYRPFTLIMFAIEYQLFGLNPFWGHLFNLIWFGITCVLLYFLLLKLLSYRSNTEGVVKENIQTTWHYTFVAFSAALLFAVHPIHTEVVANIKGRDEIMALLGSLAAVWFSIKAFENQGAAKTINTGLAFLMSFMALMSKENAITFVLILPLMYWFFLKTSWAEAFKATLPLILSAALFLILRGVVIGNQFGGEQFELLNNPYIKIVNNQYVPFEFSEKLSTIIYTLGRYIGLLIVPHPLTHDYYPNHIGLTPFGDPGVTLSLVLHITLVIVLFKNWQKRSLVSFSIIFYLLTLSIVSNLVFPVGTHMAERFIFMPSVAFCLLCAIYLEKILRGGKIQVALGLLIGVSILFSLKTFTRNLAWKDDYTLFTTDVSTSENSAKVQCSAGGQMIERAIKIDDKTQRDAMLNEAIEHLQRSIMIHPNYKEPYNLLGNAFAHLGKMEDAVVTYQKALKIDPNFKVAQANLAAVSSGAKIQQLKNLGLEYGQKKMDYNKAIEYFNEALKLDPNDAQLYSYLGTCYGMKGEPQKAIEVLEKGLSLRKDKQDAMNLSQSYRILGNASKAQEWEKKAQSFK